jgi:hypothetical protein
MRYERKAGIAIAALVPSWLPRDRYRRHRAATGTYCLVENWAQLPPGTEWGVMSAVGVDAQGNVFAFQRSEPTSKVMVFDAGEILADVGRRRVYLPSWTSRAARRHGLDCRSADAADAQIRRRWNAPDVARSERRSRRQQLDRQIQRRQRRRNGRERRHLRVGRRGRKLARREVFQRRRVHQILGDEGRGPGRAEYCPRHRDGFQRTCVGVCSRKSASRYSIRTARTSIR